MITKSSQNPVTPSRVRLYSYPTATLLQILLLLHVQVGVRAQVCSLCNDGSQADLNRTIGGGANGVKCSTLVDNGELGTDACLKLQMLGYTDCGCPTHPPEYCSMCDDDFTDLPDPTRTVPGTDTLCTDLLFARVNDTFTCDDAKKPGYVCGCPNAPKPTCYICGDATGQPTDGSAAVAAEGVGSFTCTELVDQALLGSLTDEQCAAVQAVAPETCKCSNVNTDATETQNDETPSLAPQTTNDAAQVVSDSTSSATVASLFSSAAAMTLTISAAFL